MSMDAQSDDGKLLAKMKKDPTVPLGLAGLVGVVLYGAYNYKKKNFSTSVYLINLRVAAQGTVISCMTLGIVYSLLKKNWDKIFPEKKN